MLVVSFFVGKGAFGTCMLKQCMFKNACLNIHVLKNICSEKRKDGKEKIIYGGDIFYV